jgi:hypothetical protein
VHISRRNLLYMRNRHSLCNSLPQHLHHHVLVRRIRSIFKIAQGHVVDVELEILIYLLPGREEIDGQRKNSWRAKRPPDRTSMSFEFYLSLGEDMRPTSTIMGPLREDLVFIGLAKRVEDFLSMSVRRRTFTVTMTSPLISSVEVGCSR